MNSYFYKLYSYYLFQGIQAGFLLFILPVYLSVNYSLAEVSLLLVITGVPWSMKFLLSPFVDRVKSKRKMILVCQFSLLMILALMSIMPELELSLVLMSSGLLSLFFAVQDIALDTFVVDEAVEKSSKISGVMESAKMFGTIVGALSCGMILDSGLEVCYQLLFLFYVLNFCLFFLFLKESNHHGVSLSIGKTVGLAILQLSSKALRSTFIICLFFGIPIGLVNVIVPNYFMDFLGWQKSDYIQNVGIFAPLGGVFGGLLAVGVSSMIRRNFVLFLSGTFLVLILSCFILARDLFLGVNQMRLLVFSYQCFCSASIATLVGKFFQESSEDSRATMITTSISYINFCFLIGNGLAGLMKNWQLIHSLLLGPVLVLTGVLYCFRLEIKESSTS